MAQRGEDYAAIQPVCLARAPRDFGESANQNRARRYRQFGLVLLRDSYSCQSVLYWIGYGPHDLRRWTLVAQT